MIPLPNFVRTVGAALPGALLYTIGGKGSGRRAAR